MTAAIVALAVMLTPPVEHVAPAETAPPVETFDDAPADPPVTDAPIDSAPTDDEAPSDDAPPTDDAPPPTDDAPPPRATPDERVVEPHPGVVGGYWDMDRTRGAEPKDGYEEIIAGSILVPLGIIAVSSSAATIWLSAPGQCQARWASVGADPTADQCKGLRTFGIVRVSYGSLMAITGAVLLGIGLTRREKHRKWERGASSSFAPWFGGRAGGRVWSGRFGLGRV